MAVGAGQQAEMQTAVVVVGLVIVPSLCENQHPASVIGASQLPSASPAAWPSLPAPAHKDSNQA